jgi:hypothetical protein
MRGLWLAAGVLAALVLMPSSRVAAQETTDEILVGYNSEQDRRDAEKDFAGAKDKLKVRGQSLESLQVQAISDKALKLKVGLPAAVKAEIARTPSAEASILQGLAEQLKQGDNRVAYAHPNWVMRGLPPAARASSIPALPVGKKISSIASGKQSKRIAKAGKRAKTHLARKRSRGKLAAARRCRCWREVIWTVPCGTGRTRRMARRGFGW